jgi:hypothetical protein
MPDRNYVLEAIFGKGDIDLPLMDIYARLREIPSVPEDLLNDLFEEIVKLVPSDLNTLMRDARIYEEYLIYSKIPKGQRLSFGKGKGTWEAAMGDKHNIDASSIRSVITRMKEHFNES